VREERRRPMRVLTPGLTFEAERHRYTVAGRRLPGVTSIIAAAGFTNEWATYSDEARDRGTRVHLATMLDDEGDLDEGSVLESDRPFLEAWRRFRRETRFYPLILPGPPPFIFREVAAGSAVYNFATILDAVGILPGFGQTPCVVEIKTGGYDDCTASLQTAGQQLVLEENGVHTRPRCAVQLSEDGTYRIHQHRDYINDRDDFLACLRVMRRLGKFQKEEA
jgi:hypothetical protein